MKRLAIAAVLSLICFPLSAAAQNQPTLETAGRIVRLLEDSGYRYTKLSPSMWSITFKGEEMASVLVLVMPVPSTSRVAEEVIIEGVVAFHDEVSNPTEMMRQLLKSNATVDEVTLIIDADEDYVARARYELGTMTGASFKTALLTVASATDDVYASVKSFVSSGGSTGATSSTSTYRVSAAATQRVEILNGKASISFNPAKWKEEKSTEIGRQSFQHMSGDGYAMVIAERIQVPTDRLREIAIENARESASDARIVEEQRRRVNGADILLLRIEGTIQRVPFTYLGYYYGGPAGTVQVITFTGQNLFEEYRKDFEEFLNGFIVQP